MIQGSPGTANSQTFSNLVVNPGGSAIVLLSAASGSLVLNLGSITRNEGGTVDFTLPGGAHPQPTASTQRRPIPTASSAVGRPFRARIGPRQRHGGQHRGL